ncbi:hypothetical protein [Streptomyces prunicolor]|uniref:hypothetical protein n=1 Tax=Streptomyces prunicolor TaxID=67348 RepID=UPI001319D15A|nr:hypothetical protein [Streptomyces prunicolor]
MGGQTLAIRQLCCKGWSFSILGGVRGPSRQADRAVALLALAAHIAGCLGGLQSDQWPSNISCVFDGASGAAGIQAETPTTHQRVRFGVLFGTFRQVASGIRAKVAPVPEVFGAVGIW